MVDWGRCVTIKELFYIWFINGKFKDSILEYSSHSVINEYYQIAVLKKHPVGAVNGNEYLYYQLKKIFDENLFNNSTGLIPKINNILKTLKT